MKQKLTFAVSVVLLLAFSLTPAWTQGNTGMAKGEIFEAPGKPAVNYQVVLTGLTTGRQHKGKTDATGNYAIVGLLFTESYKMEIIDPKGDVQRTRNSVGLSGETTVTNIDLSQPEPDAAGNTSANAKPPAKLTKEQIKAENAKVASLNALVTQVQTAMQAQKWPEAEAALKQLLATNPETTRWEFYKALGDAQGHSQKYQDAVQTYDKGIEVAQSVADGKAPKDPRNPNPDPARATAGVGQMLTAQGNAYVKLEKYEEAIAAFKKAAEKSPNPMAYYNLCALQFNFNQPDAAASCDKAAAADPSKAELWFFKGTALYRAGKDENGKFNAPPGATEALNKYLQLDPNGAYAVQAKSMLQKLGSN